MALRLLLLLGLLVLAVSAQVAPSGTFSATPDAVNHGTQVPVWFKGGNLYLYQVNHTFINATDVEITALYYWNAGTGGAGFLPVVTMTVQYFIQGLVTVETIRYSATDSLACQQNAGLFGPYLCLDGGVMRYWLGTYPFSPSVVNNLTTAMTVSGPGGGYNWGGVTNALTLTCISGACNPITVPQIVTARRSFHREKTIPDVIARKAFLNLN